MTSDSQSALIVDATETSCGATGKSFWGYTGEADYLVFGKRSQIEGFFSTSESKVHSNSFGGDHLKLLQFQVINNVIQSDRLIDRVDRTAVHMRKSLEHAVSKKSQISGVSGVGTSLFINTVDAEAAQQLHYHLIQEGVLTKLNGGRGIALKPALIMEEKHVDQLVHAINKF